MRIQLWRLTVVLSLASVAASAQTPDNQQTDAVGAPAAATGEQPPAAPQITMPELLRPLAPEYPSTATGDQRVILAVTLDRDGRVQRVEVLSGAEPFASAAVRAARAGRFTPALKDGQPVFAKIKVAVDFVYSVPEAPEPPAAAVEARPAAAPADAAPPTPEPQDDIDVVVTAPRTDHSERAINRAEARVMAGTFGDPLRAVEMLPGITPLISGVPYFFVRGAPPGSVSFYIDEARIPQLYHVGPGSSVLHPQFVDAVALRSGPYRARYGDATSGVVTTRAVTDVDESAAEVEAKVFESGAYVGAPFAGRKGSVAVAGKLSHLQPVLDVLDLNVRLSYWDYQGMVSYRPSSRDLLTLLWFGAGDFVGEEEAGEIDINLDSVFHRLKLGYNRNLSSRFDLHNYVIVGIEQSRFDQQDELFSARSAGAGSVLSYVASDVWDWAGGINFELQDIDASGASYFYGSSNNAAVSRVDSQAAVWGEAHVAPVRSVQIDTGVRVAGYKSRSATALAVEPRLSSSIDWTERWSSVFAVGFSTQRPTSALPAPAVAPADLRGGLQRALQRSASLRYGWPLELTAEVTGFFNEYFDLSDPLSLSTIADPLEVGDTPDGMEPLPEDLNYEISPNGRSYGVELMLRRPFNNQLSGTLSYTLSRSTRRIGGQDVVSSFDRTHIINATAGYDLGAGFNLSTRLLLYSGLPVRTFGTTGGRTGERSDSFVRLDLRASKEWRLSWVDLMLIVEMLNTAFQKEVLGVSCLPMGCQEATFGPVAVPSIGLRGSFGGARSQAGDRAQFR